MKTHLKLDFFDLTTILWPGEFQLIAEVTEISAVLTPEGCPCKNGACKAYVEIFVGDEVHPFTNEQDGFQRGSWSSDKRYNSDSQTVAVALVRKGDSKLAEWCGIKKSDFKDRGFKLNASTEKYTNECKGQNSENKNNWVQIELQWVQNT